MNRSLASSVVLALTLACPLVPLACGPEAKDPGRVGSSSGSSSLVMGSSAVTSGTGSMQIPPGAGGELAKKQLVLFLNVKNVDQTANPELKIQEGALKVANIELESLMPRMKRFRVFAIYNEGAQQMARSLSEAGEMAAVPAKSLPAPDLYLSATLTFNVERAELSGTEKKEQYSMTSVREYKGSLLYSLTGPDQQVLTDMADASGVIRPEPVRKLVGEALDPSTNKLIYRGGFNPRNPDNQAEVIREIVADMQAGLAAKLALSCPLTAKVTALNPSGTRFALEAGSSNGVYSGGKVIVWVDDGSFTYCLAETEAEPTVQKANLTILRWNESDPDALPIIQKLKANPASIKDYQIWGTTVDIPRQEMLKPQ
jgi:hypothetical protein